MNSLAEMMAAEQRERARRLYRASLVVLVLAVVVAGLLLWRDLRDDRPHAKVGSFTTTRDVLPAQWRRTVLVPGGRFDVTAAVRDDVTDDPEVHSRQAPDGGAFVALTVKASPRPGPNIPDGDARDRDEPTAPRFTLVADGRRHEFDDLSDTYTAPPSGVAYGTRLPVNGWLAVGGAADRLVLEVSWQGRVQRLDLRSGKRTPGDFAELYRQRSVGNEPVATTSCGTPTWTPGWRAGPGAPLVCTYRADRLAWTKSLGWARTGRQWLALTTRTARPSGFLHRVDGRDIAYSNTAYGSSAAETSEVSESPDRVDGAAPVALVNVRAAGEAPTVVQLFDVAGATTTHTAVITQSARVRAREGSGSTSTYVDDPVGQTWTIAVR